MGVSAEPSVSSHFCAEMPQCVCEQQWLSAGRCRCVYVDILTHSGKMCEVRFMRSYVTVVEGACLRLVFPETVVV